MKKDLHVIEAINCVAFYNQMKKEVMDAIPLKIKWALKRAIEKMADDVKAYEEFRDNELQKIKDVYFDDEHSVKDTTPRLDDDQKEVKDDDGNPIMDEIIKVKDEYLEEYQAKISELNTKLEEILMETNTYEYNSVDIDEYIDGIDDKIVDFDTLNMIDAILGEKE